MYSFLMAVPMAGTMVPLAEARSRLGELVSQARHGHEPVTLTDHGEPVAAIIGTEELAELRQAAAAAAYLADKEGMRARGVVVTCDEDLEAALDRYEADGSWG
jgi:prevent-host-death family protein